MRRRRAAAARGPRGGRGGLAPPPGAHPPAPGPPLTAHTHRKRSVLPEPVLPELVPPALRPRAVFRQRRGGQPITGGLRPAPARTANGSAAGPEVLPAGRRFHGRLGDA